MNFDHIEHYGVKGMKWDIKKGAADKSRADPKRVQKELMSVRIKRQQIRDKYIELQKKKAEAEKALALKKVAEDKKLKTTKTEPTKEQQEDPVIKTASVSFSGSRSAAKGRASKTNSFMADQKLSEKPFTSVEKTPSIDRESIMKRLFGLRQNNSGSITDFRLTRRRPDAEMLPSSRLAERH